MIKYLTRAFLLFPPRLQVDSPSDDVINVVSDRSNVFSANVPCSGDRLKLKTESGKLQ